LLACCGAYVSYMLSTALLGYHDDYLCVLAGIATIADMMELKDYNRNIVRLALKNMNNNYYLPLRLLSGEGVIDEAVIGLKIAPKINAIGRMKEDYSPNKLVEYLLCDDKEQLEKLYKWIEDINEERRTLTASVSDSLSYNKDFPSIICHVDVKEGLIGLIANKLMQENNKPCIILTSSSENENLFKGSARSKNGFSISESFEKLKDLLDVYGGHAAAGGLTIKKENLNEFIIRFNELAQNHPFQEEDYDSNSIKLDITEISLDNLKIIKSLGPFGVGFSRPLFKVEDFKCSALTYTKTKEHILYQLSMSSKIIGFNISESSLSEFNFINMYGTMQNETFRGHESVVFKIEHYLGK
ncbi:MAG: hypothetical protein HUJ61_02770, partial [Bacilli bacterium]|nr:hypothetical protein [Bacilli bacterium]